MDKKRPYKDTARKVSGVILTLTGALIIVTAAMLLSGNVVVAIIGICLTVFGLVLIASYDAWLFTLEAIGYSLS